MKISQMVTDLCGVQECLEKISKGHILETKKGEQPSLRPTHCLYQFFLQFSKGHNSETKKGETIILVWDTLS